jgi:hypothetical protein
VRTTLKIDFQAAYFGLLFSVARTQHQPGSARAGYWRTPAMVSARTAAVAFCKWLPVSLIYLGVDDARLSVPL